MLQATQNTQLLYSVSSKMVVFMYILTSLLHYASPALETAYGTKWKNFTDVLVDSNIISDVQNIGNKFTCLGLCLENKACVSVFFRQQQQRCQLHDVLFVSPQDGQEEMGTLYFSITTDGCPPTYVHNRILNFCYEVQFNNLDYISGVADCNSRGDHFIVIDSQDKQDHIRKQIVASSDGLQKKYLLDGTDEVTEGTWLFHDGRKMTYSAWAPGYPKNKTADKDFIVADPSDHFLWGDKEGNTPKRYICERDI
ncbi:perlucin-like [Haliotis asinina]|uniref:perlucin-like n=1 Tax=Haliotis asinina TaxID=109174 RepID=UPI0035321859